MHQQQCLHIVWAHQQQSAVSQWYYYQKIQNDGGSSAQLPMIYSQLHICNSHTYGLRTRFLCSSDSLGDMDSYKLRRQELVVIVSSDKLLYSYSYLQVFRPFAAWKRVRCGNICSTRGAAGD